jgi:hypothetical protein
VRPAVGALLLALALLGCRIAAQGAPPPTEAEARQLLARIVQAAQIRDFDGLCALGDANCPDMLAAAGRASVPAAPPTIVGVEAIQPADGGNGAVVSGGILFLLCGVDGLGKPYYSEMFVLRSGAGLTAIQPIYWSGMRLARDPTAGAEPPRVLPGCPSG